MGNPVTRLRAKWEEIKAGTAQQHRAEAGVEAIVGFIEEMSEDYDSHQQRGQLADNQNPQGGDASTENPPPTAATVENKADSDSGDQTEKEPEKENTDGSQEQSQGS